MSRNIKRPNTQVLLTNVVYVRFKFNKKKRFEIACYPNKVLDWRRGVETNLDEVVQMERVFMNASRGIEASAKDLQKAFGTTDHAVAVEHILLHGELQISKRERRANLDKTFKEVANIITSKCINVESGRPFPLSVIEKAMREIHFSINPKKRTKAMALQLIPQLQDVLPIDRAQMRLRLTFPGTVGKKKINKTQIKPELGRLVSSIVSEQRLMNAKGPVFVFEVLIDPGQLRAIDELVGKLSRGTGSLEITDSCVKNVNVEFLVPGQTRLKFESALNQAQTTI